MANPQMILISSQSLSGTAASVTFSSIPQIYTDLKIVFSARTDRAGNVGDSVGISYNGSSTSLSMRYLLGDGAAVSSASGSTGNAGMAVGSAATASTFGNSEIYIPNYTSAVNKSSSGDGVSENNASGAYQGLWATLWSNTSAITSITLASINAANFVQYSTFYLYGITRQ